MSSLFRVGDFTLHSGGKSRWKIVCDSLTPEDWQALALMASEVLPPFGPVVGIPRGGLAFAYALQKHSTPGCTRTLLADDVCTTGASFLEWRDKLANEPTMLGVVAFARGVVPWWVVPIFQMRAKQ